jgi:hypothetical protein
MKTRWPWALPWAHRWAGKANDVHGGETGRSYRSVGDEIGSHCRGRGLRRAEKAGGALWAIPGHWAGLALHPAISHPFGAIWRCCRPWPGRLGWPLSTDSVCMPVTRPGLLPDARLLPPHVSARPRGLGLPVRAQSPLLPVMARLSERAVVRREIAPPGRTACRRWPGCRRPACGGDHCAPVPASPRGRMPTDRHS